MCRLRRCAAGRHRENTADGYPRYDLAKLKPKLFRAKPMHTVAPLPMPVSPVTLRKRTFKVSSRKNQKLLDGVRKAVEEARA